MGVLDRLGYKYGTDKAHYHHYMDFYEYYLTPLRDREVVLLEIGVGEGGSLRMWRDYFPLGRIIGMDTWDKRHLEAERIETIVGNSGDRDDLARVANLGPFDVINDDGGHVPEDQILAYQKLLPHLKPGGVYLLEDVIDPFTVEHLTGIARDIILGRLPYSIETVAFYLKAFVTKLRNS